MAEHSVVIDDRGLLTVTGVTDVIGFDGETVVLDTKCGRLTVEGSGLSVNDLSVESGKISASGTVTSIAYSKPAQEKTGFFSKLFR